MKPKLSFRNNVSIAGLTMALLVAGCGAPAAPAAPTAAVTPTIAPAEVATEVPAVTEAPAATEAMTQTVEATAVVTTEAEATTAPVAAVELPAVNPAELSGNINTGGSSTVYPLSVAMIESFKRDGFPGEVKIDSVGSGAGIDRFCRGEYDVANSSRAINESEITTCQAAGLDPLPFRVGIDALTIVVNKANTWATNLTTQQLTDIFSGTAKTWADVDPAWPTTPIKVFSPGTDSGTFDFFVETVFADVENAENIIPQVPGVQLSENDNVLVQGVEGDEGAIGYFGFAYFDENKERLNAVAFNGTKPNAATVAAGTYGFSRPLFIISTAKIIQEKPQVAGFLNYYLTNVNKLIRGVGYFPETEDSLNASKQALLDAMQ